MSQASEVASFSHMTSSSIDMECDSVSRSAIEIAYEKILQRIICGELVAGEVLTSAGLAEELEMSRTPVVAAIDRLVADSIVAKGSNRRLHVKDSSEGWMVQIHGLRERLEPYATEKAATRMPEKVMEKLENISTQVANASNDDDWLKASWRFDYSLHLSIADYCGNTPICETIYKCWEFNRITYQIGVCTERVLKANMYDQHRQILSAIRQRNSELAQAAMTMHLRASVWPMDVYTRPTHQLGPRA